ncbi:uncharacterized protein LOC133778950 [Humulus lupulus]|uniref:uncharacterized protein LOC133778950 n=1 Tax=Humulus lupulus TaxID=3486 RepID=UPI002B405257|nr:uncharacterized protein LOC133778950 [Humulus lupulus]
MTPPPPPPRTPPRRPSANDPLSSTFNATYEKLQRLSKHRRSQEAFSHLPPLPNSQVISRGLSEVLSGILTIRHSWCRTEETKARFVEEIKAVEARYAEEMKAVEAKHAKELIHPTVIKSIAALALHRSISWSRARIEEIRGEHQAAQVALATAQQQERDAKAALETTRENERVAQAASVAAQTKLEASQIKLQEAEATKVALATAKIELEEAKDARAALDAAKVEAEEAKAALAAERVQFDVFCPSMEDWIGSQHHCAQVVTPNDQSYWDGNLKFLEKRLELSKLSSGIC